MFDKDSYKIKRIMRKIKIKIIAKYVGCSSTTISRFENEEDFNMIDEKIERYKEFIDRANGTQ